MAYRKTKYNSEYMDIKTSYIRETLNYKKEGTLRTITFYSTKSCPNCMVMKRWVNDLHLNVEYVTLDGDSPEVEKYKITSVPTIIVQEEDAEVARISGAHTLAALKSFFSNSGVLN